MRSRNALGIPSSDVPIGNLLWVDTVNAAGAGTVPGCMAAPGGTLASLGLLASNLGVAAYGP
jgi:hypothetical protein